MNSILRNMLLAVLAIPVATGSCVAYDEQLANLEQKAFADAVAEVADAVVQIRTIGGLDRVGKTLVSQGPTTGVIVSEDGYIVSSAFNFASKPSSILVRLANGQQHAAELVGRDKNRMLVLLKINTNSALPVPTAVEPNKVQVGQWAIALGRTFQPNAVDISIGIVSATNRMYGRVIQTDANVSVANYGGPLVDISGRVFGVLVPMSPQASAGENAELAGAEFYDSGIGFAVPLQHVFGILERWKAEKDLLPGKLGIGLKAGDAHVTPPRITSIWPGSPASEAKWQAEDLITAVNGTPVSTQAQLRFQIVPNYSDDKLSVTLDREGETIETEVTLAGELPPYRHAFLGILPEDGTTEDEKGVVIKLVWPDSPAELAELKPGDRITKVDATTINHRGDLQAALTASHPGKSATVVYVRNNEENSARVPLVTLPDTVLSPTDLASLAGGNAQIEAEPKLEELMVPEFTQKAVFFVPESETSREPGLLLWLGDGDSDQDQQLIDDWKAACQNSAMIMMIAPPKKGNDWLSSDLGYLQQLMRLATRQLKIDRSRIVVVGSGKAGQLAYALTLTSPSNFGAVVGIDAPLPRTLTLRDTAPSNRVTVLAIESEGSNFTPLIRRDIKRLRDKGYPTTWLQKPTVNDGDDSLDPATRASISRWIIGLSRL